MDSRNNWISISAALVGFLFPLTNEDAQSNRSPNLSSPQATIDQIPIMIPTRPPTLIGLMRPEPAPVPEVDGIFQVRSSDLVGCQPGLYEINGRFDDEFMSLTLNDAGGAEGCFDQLPIQLLTTPLLVDGVGAVPFESNAGPDQSRIKGNILQVHGLFNCSSDKHVSSIC